jgi:hypothetical protein
MEETWQEREEISMNFAITLHVQREREEIFKRKGWIFRKQKEKNM